MEAKPASTQREMPFVGQSKQKDVRHSNIVAAKAIADAIRTSLGPKGMDKMITSSSGDVTITNDGATILNKMEVFHPAAKMLVELSKAQDVEAGDGTTSVAVIAGALLDAAEMLMEKGIHPSIISDAFQLAATKSNDILESIAIPVDLSDRQNLIRSALTSLSSKVVASNADTLAPIAVDAVMRVIESQASHNVDLRNIRIVKRLGGTLDDIELIDGIVFNQRASRAAGGPTRVVNAKIGLIQFQLSAPKTDMENQIVISDYQQMDRILKDERKYILKLIKGIIKTGCNLLLIQKSILRDAVNELSLHYLAKKKVMVVTDIERDEIEFISKTLGCQPVAHIDGFQSEKLGHAELVEDMQTAEGRAVKITGVKNPGSTVTVLIRGSNRLMLDEAERSLHDALCVVRSLVKQRFMVVGGGAPEMELSLQLRAFAKTLVGTESFCVRAFAEAMEVIPYTLAENAGMHSISVVTDLRQKHSEGQKNAGINIRKRAITDMLTENVVQPLLVNTSAISLATECVRLLLKIDDIVAVR